jgi:hypothetical protein
MKRRFAGVLVALAAFGVVAVPTAGAAAPTKSHFDFSNSTSITDICPFSIHLEARASVEDFVFTNASGDITKIIDHAVEHDTFSAHGTTIRTASYHYALHVLFDDAGNLLHLYATGVVVRMRLPDGTPFSAAGRVDFLNSMGPFTRAPVVGHSGNVAAFCQALS